MLCRGQLGQVLLAELQSSDLNDEGAGPSKMERKSSSRRKREGGEAQRWGCGDLLEVRWDEGRHAWNMVEKRREETGKAHTFHNFLQSLAPLKS